MKIVIANRFHQRLWGLLGRRSLATTEGMYFPRCSAVHTWCMRFPIMVVFCRDGQIVKLIPVLKPWRYAICREADSVFEFSLHLLEVCGFNPAAYIWNSTLCSSSTQYIDLIERVQVFIDDFYRGFPLKQRDFASR